MIMPIVAGDSTIPKWVLARVTDSRDRKGVSGKLRNETLKSVLILAYFTWMGFFRFQTPKSPGNIFDNLYVRIFLLILLIGLHFKDLIAIVKARQWLDEYQKWSEISEMEWFEPKPQSIMVPILLGVIPLTLVCLWIWFS
jgi:hypothetical protein